MRIRVIAFATLASLCPIVCAFGCSGKASGPDLFAGPDADPDSHNYSGDGGPITDTAFPPRSALVIGFDSDLVTPDELDAFRIEITQNDATQFSKTFDIASDPLPNSLTICASNALCNNVFSGFLPPGKIVALDTTSPITISVMGLLKNKFITMQTVRTRLLPNRVLALPVSIDAACVGQIDVQGRVVESACPTDQTCIAGACAPIDVDPSTLNDAP